MLATAGLKYSVDLTRSTAVKKRFWKPARDGLHSWNRWLPAADRSSAPSASASRRWPGYPTIIESTSSVATIPRMICGQPNIHGAENTMTAPRATTRME